MAQSDNTVLYILIAALGVGALYITRQFCPSGVLPTDAFDGKLCYQGGSSIGTPGSDDCISGGCTDKITGKAVITSTVGAIGGGNTRCGPGFVLVQGACTCAHNTTFARCPAGYGLYNNKTSCGCGNCKTAKCPTGSHSVVGTGGVGCICIKNAPTGGSCNKVCTGGYVKNNNPCSCVCNSIVHKCGANATAKGNGKTCSCYCNNGYISSGGNCVKSTGQQGGYGGPAPGPTAIQVNNAKLFIADVINRTVQACTGRNIGTTAVVQGYPSAISSMAKMNNYSQNKILAYNNRPFAKTFRSVVMAIVGSYKLNLSPTCTQQMACLNSMSMKECHLL